MTTVDFNPRRGRHSLPLEKREFWRLYEVAAVLGISITMLKALVREGRFLKPVRIADSTSMSLWRAREVRAWVNAGCPEPERWKWKPTVLLTLDEQIEQKREELKKIRLQLEQCEARMNSPGRHATD